MYACKFHVVHHTHYSLHWFQNNSKKTMQCVCTTKITAFKKIILCILDSHKCHNILNDCVTKDFLQKYVSEIVFFERAAESMPFITCTRGIALIKIIMKKCVEKLPQNKSHR